ncbi:MAG: hypothetical protein SPL82_14090, partial [Lachnospiraceae bacterium]|nr:hypothetical protein [Lachnospiraceae bacterium]
VSKTQHNALPNGVIALKGGDLSEELKPFGKKVMVMLLKRPVMSENSKQRERMRQRQESKILTN